MYNRGNTKSGGSPCKYKPIGKINFSLSRADSSTRIHAPSFHTGPGMPALHKAYKQAEKITAEHSKSFYFASGLLPEEKRSAVRALYAFCRTVDDIVDESSDADYDSQLDYWRGWWKPPPSRITTWWPPHGPILSPATISPPLRPAADRRRCPRPLPDPVIRPLMSWQHIVTVSPQRWD
jgi:hypothetical protein